MWSVLAFSNFMSVLDKRSFFFVFLAMPNGKETKYYENVRFQRILTIMHDIDRWEKYCKHLFVLSNSFPCFSTLHLGDDSITHIQHHKALTWQQCNTLNTQQRKLHLWDTLMKAEMSLTLDRHIGNDLGIIHFVLRLVRGINRALFMYTEWEVRFL